MVSPDVIEIVRARFGNIKERARAVSGVAHSGLRGRFREILAEDLVAPYIPPHMELLTGAIVGPDDTIRSERNEDDIVLFDHNQAPLLIKTRGRDSYIPITGVRAHIEVKSTLTKDDMRDALRAAIELNNLAPDGRTAPVGLIFAYQTDIGLRHYIPELLLTMTKELSYSPETASGLTPCPIQGVVILGRGSWFLTQVPGQESGWYEVQAEQDRELLAFVSIISNYAYGNKLGLGTYILDTSWLIGPKPASPLTV